MAQFSSCICRSRVTLKKWNSFPQYRADKYQLLVDRSFVFLQPVHVLSSRAKTALWMKRLCALQNAMKTYSAWRCGYNFWLMKPLPADYLKLEKCTVEKQDSMLAWYLNFLPRALLVDHITHETLEQANLWSDSLQLFLGSKGREYGPSFTQWDLQQIWENVQLPFILVSFASSVLHFSAFVKLSFHFHIEAKWMWHQCHWPLGPCYTGSILTI